MNKTTRLATCLSVLIALALFALPLSGGAPPTTPPTPNSVTYTEPFGYLPGYTPPPTQGGLTHADGTLLMPELPVGFNCTSVTITLSNWCWMRRFEVAEVGGQENGWVTFNDGAAQVGVELIGPDGVHYARARTSLPAFDVLVPAGGSYVNQASPYGLSWHPLNYNFGWDQQLGTQQNPSLPPITWTVPVSTPALGEGHSPMSVFPTVNIWTLRFGSMLPTTYSSGDLRVREVLGMRGAITITFNH